MTKGITLATGPEGGLKLLLKHLLEGGTVQGIFVLTRIENGKVAYALVTDPAKIDDSAPLYPVMPVNLGQILHRFAVRKGVTRPVAVVARPCELRAFVETMKRRQWSLDNVLIISHTCPGVYTLRTSVERDLDEELPGYWEHVHTNTINTDLRPACRSCTEFVPYTADLTLRLVDAGKDCTFLANNERGERLIEGLTGKRIEGELDRERIEGLLNKRAEQRFQLLGHQANIKGLDDLVGTFGKCINCHACGRACPICSCTLCAFESTTYEKNPGDFDQALLKKKGVRLPPDTMFFHLGRMLHMAVSCVACGSCQDVCPVEIPVSLVFKRVGESLQKTFGYVPGRDLKEPLPVNTFNVEEFIEVEE